MMIRISFLLLLTIPAAAPALPDPILVLSDEFDDGVLEGWQRVKDAETWPNDQLEALDEGSTRAGWLTMIPHTTSWYEDYRGPLLFKEVTGDFVMTTRVHASNRAGTGAPAREYSLAGIMVRAPRDITPDTWQPGGEKYSFLSIGSANAPGTFQYEVKTTSNEDEFGPYSLLQITNSDCNCGDAIIQTARIGTVILQIAKTESGPWRVVNRYRRPDLPQTVQVGLVAYTDWPNVAIMPPTVHNSTTITEVYGQPGVPTQPDLRAQFDYARFLTPVVPAEFTALDLANTTVVSDAQILSFLGANARSISTIPDGDLWITY
jgi:hypothetical protein